MKMRIICTCVLLSLLATAQAADPVKVFILAGQSNMEGHAAARTLDYLGKDPTDGHLLKHVKNRDGSVVTREDVWVAYKRNETIQAGNLTDGYGAKEDRFGPELGFGIAMGDLYDEQVLLIKTAWGGKNIYSSFRPPSSGGDVGKYYTLMIENVKETLSQLQALFPSYDGRGYEIAGFVWFQGYNDMISDKTIPEYEGHLSNLIKDLRREFNVPDMPVVIGEIGVGGPSDPEGQWSVRELRKAQKAVTELPALKERVRCG